MGLDARVRRGILRFLCAVLALVCAADAAVAQLLPGSVQPGREREQLIDRRTAPRVTPGGPAISLPSTEAPAGAAKTVLTIRRVQIVGSTVYSDEQLAPLYRDLLNRQVTLEVGLRHRQAHHRQVRRRRLCALSRHRAAAGAEPRRRDHPHPGDRGLCQQGRMAAREARPLPRLLLGLYRKDRRRPADQHPHPRALPAPGQRPARPEVHHHAASLENRAGRGGADRRGHRETARRQCALRQPWHQGARSVPVPGRADVQQCVGHARGDHGRLCGHDADRRIAVRRAQLPPCADQRGPHRVRQRELRLGTSRARRNCASSTTRRAAPSSRPASTIR